MITFGGKIDDHTVGDKECINCWRDPTVCPECGGLVHTEFDEEISDDHYTLLFKCERCGETSNPD